MTKGHNRLSARVLIWTGRTGRRRRSTVGASQSPVGSSPDLDAVILKTTSPSTSSTSQSPVGSSPDLDVNTGHVKLISVKESQSPVGSSPDLDAGANSPTRQATRGCHNRLSARVLIWTLRRLRRICVRHDEGSQSPVGSSPDLDWTNWEKAALNGWGVTIACRLES